MTIKKLNSFIYRLMFCTVLSGISLNSISQDTIRVRRVKNSIHADGATLLYVGMYSLNYERTVFQTTILKVNFRSKKHILVVLDDSIDSKTEKLDLMKLAVTDPLFIADIDSVSNGN